MTTLAMIVITISVCVYCYRNYVRISQMGKSDFRTLLMEVIRRGEDGYNAGDVSRQMRVPLWYVTLAFNMYSSVREHVIREIEMEAKKRNEGEMNEKA